jgi:hypothetical protein
LKFESHYPPLRNWSFNNNFLICWNIRHGMTGMRKSNIPGFLLIRTFFW